MLLLRLVGLLAFAAVLGAPALWAAGILVPAAKRRRAFFRWVLAAGLGLAAYVSVVNLLGRLFESSTVALAVYLLVNAGICVYLWRSRVSLGWSELWAERRRVALLVLAGLLVSTPQWLFGVSTNYWDETVSSANHLTAANQFAEGIFPPRYNAFPDLDLKYHYGFTILSGTVRWLTGLSANVSIDIAHTLLCLFIFFFVVAWLEELRFSRFAAFSAGFTTVLGGGLSWLYVKRLEAFGGFRKTPTATELLHRYDPELGWWGNLVEVTSYQNFHLHNADGTYSSLPLELTNYLQQHAVPLGIALSLVGFYLFCSWRARRNFSPLLLSVTGAVFGVSLLGHAVFGGAACVAAGLILLSDWIRNRSWAHFASGALFTAVAAGTAFLHGGMLARGDAYVSTGSLTTRGDYGYTEGGVRAILDWHLAGFGIPLLVALVALVSWRGLRLESGERRTLFQLSAIYAGFSYFAPQFTFYAYNLGGGEQATEISKFFFCTHLGIALLYGFGVDLLPRRLRQPIVLPLLALSSITPIVVCYAGSFEGGRWSGFYRSPYAPVQDQHQKIMGETLAAEKRSNRDVYFDYSRDERRTGFLSELLLYGGSVFTLTPSRYERTGAYPLSPEVVGERLRLNSRMARLLPGAAEESETRWFYVRPHPDMNGAPILVRSRFEKLVAEGYFRQTGTAGPRALFEIVRPTYDADLGIERYWTPKIISQTRTDWDGDGRNDLIFYDWIERKLLAGEQELSLPGGSPPEELSIVYVGNLDGDERVDFLAVRMEDTVYLRAGDVSQLVELNPLLFSKWSSTTGEWRHETSQWYWPLDLPYIADLEGDGTDEVMAYYRMGSGPWVDRANRELSGPVMAAELVPLPLAGRFFQDSRGELGLWSLTTGQLTLRSLGVDLEQSFEWGGLDGDVLVPGDYDGDGYDEVAIWQRQSRTWFVRDADGTISQVAFGTETGVPLPFDYDSDGRLDLAYWEPAERRIEVSFDFGESVSRTVVVPEDALPAFVNMY